MNTRHKPSVSSKYKIYLYPILVIFIILAIFSSVTYAWVVSTTEAIDNKFVLQKLTMDLQETFDDAATVKEKVQVENTGEADLYVRINLALQILDEDGNSIATPVTFDSEGKLVNKPISLENYIDFTYGNSADFNTEDWLLIGDYYYYKYPLKPGETTDVLFDTAKQQEEVYFYDVTGASTIYTKGSQSLALTVLSEGIQVNGVTSAWDVTLDENRNITGGTN